MTEAEAAIELDFATLNARFERSYPQDALTWASQTYGDRLALVTSFQPSGIVMLHMLSEIAPRTPVLTLDTGLLFPETYALMDELENLFNLNLIRVRPAQTVEQQNATFGPALWERDPDRCCNMRKVQPLNEVLAGYGAWIAGLRRDQSKGRAKTPIVAWDEKCQMVKLAPLASWSEDMVWTYLHAHELPYNTLHDQGYPSIGCWPCTRAVDSTSGDLRAGRWGDFAKTECGIHVR